MGGEEVTVGGMYVGIDGDVTGGVLLVFPRRTALHRRPAACRPAGTLTDVSDVDFSGLSEMGNIVAASFINAMADATHAGLPPAVPEISIDMCQPVIDSVLARFNSPGTRSSSPKRLSTARTSRPSSATSSFFWTGLPRTPPAPERGRSRGGPATRGRVREHVMAEIIVNVKMAELDVVNDARRLKTILGSCVGIILRDPERGVSGLPPHHAARAPSR